MKTLLMPRTKKSKVLRILLIIFHVLLPINDSALVEFPNNTAVTNATNRTEFKCKSDDGYLLRWFMQANNTAQRQVLAFASEIKSAQAKSYCSIENEKGGEFNLILKIRGESAQTYTCHEPETSQEKSAELIIMEPTKFEKDVNESHVTLICSVNFRGNWAPELELSHNGSSIVEGVDASAVPNQNVSSLLVIPRDNSASTGKYTCTVRFGLKGKPQRTTDNSVPSYMETSILTVNVEETQPGIPSDGNSKGSVTAIAIVWLFLLLLVLMLMLVLGVFAARRYLLTKKRRSALPIPGPGYVTVCST